MLSIFSHQGEPKQIHSEREATSRPLGRLLSGKRRKITSIDQDVEKLEPSTLLRGRSLEQPRGGPGRGLLRTLKAEPPRDPAAALLSPHSEGPKPGARAGECSQTCVQRSSTHNCHEVAAARAASEAKGWASCGLRVLPTGGAGACVPPRAADRRGWHTPEVSSTAGMAGRAGRALPSLSLAGVGLGGSRRGVSAR